MAFPNPINITDRSLNILNEAQSGDVNGLENYLKENSLYVNVKNYYGRTALHLAAEEGNLTALTTLIKAGADVDRSTSRRHKHTSVMMASRGGHLSCLQALIKAGAWLDDLDQNGKPPLLLARDLQCFQALIEGGACVNQRTRDGVPLIAAVSSREKLKALIKAGADVHLIDGDGKTALMYPTEIHNIKTLLSLGLNPNVQDNNGKTALMYACEPCTYYKNKIVRILLEAGAKVNKTDHSGRTALMMASENGNSGIVKALLEAKAGANKNDRDSKTALMYARDQECVKALVYLGGANPHTRDNNRRTALMMAAEAGYSGVVHGLLEVKADANKQDRDGKTALMYARDQECVKALVYLGGANPHTRDNNRRTALMMAAEAGYSGVVHGLLEVKADPNEQDRNGKTALMYTRNVNCINALIHLGRANPNMRDKDGTTALMDACMADTFIDRDITNTDPIAEKTPLEKNTTRPTAVQALLKAGADVDRADHSGHTALMMAAEAGNSRNVEIILQFKANPNKQDRDGTTALMYACMADTNSHHMPNDTRPTAMQVLLQSGADVDIADHSGRTALMMAAEAGNSRILQIILQFKANPNKQDRDGKTALMYACMADTNSHHMPNDTRPTAMQALLEAGADVDITDLSEHTALMMAAEAGNSRILEIILQFKANPNKKDRCGKTALMYAKNFDCREMLISHGADVNLMDTSQCTVFDYTLEELARTNYESIYDAHGVKSTFLLLLNNGSNPVINAKYKKFLHVCVIIKSTVQGKISNDEKQLIRLFVCNGEMNSILVPFNKTVRRFVSTDTSLLKYVLRTKQVDMLKYFIANCYLTQNDLADMRDTLVEVRRNETLRNMLQRKRKHDHQWSSVWGHHIQHQKRQDETQDLLVEALSQPWPLVKLAFIAVSSALGPSSGRAERISKTGLPDILQRMLMFQEPVSRLPVREWEDIPLTFDPVEYEKLPKPRPLLYYWPVGRDLVI